MIARNVVTPRVTLAGPMSTFIQNDKNDTNTHKALGLDWLRAHSYFNYHNINLKYYLSSIKDLYSGSSVYLE